MPVSIQSPRNNPILGNTNMSTPPGKKYKQALLPFKTSVSSKKRKLEDENTSEDVKCKKTYLDETDPQNGILEEANEHINDRKDDDSTNVTTPNKNKLHQYLKPVTRIYENDKTDTVSDEPRVQKMDVDETAAENNSLANANNEEKKQNLPKLDETYEEQMPVPECSKTVLENERVNNVNSADDALNSSKCADVSVSESDTSFNTTDSSLKNVPENIALLSKKLTPKQLQKKREAELKKQERERLKQEKEQKKQLEKELKEKKRLAEIEAKNEEKRLKEEERKAKEEEKRVKEEERKAKEEEKRIKLLAKEEEKRQKDEEKRQKDEEKRQKDEEKRQKDEEKRQKDEQEKKVKEKTAAMFTNFFLKNKSTQPKNNVEIDEKSQCSRFMPFEVKADMRLANTTRATLNIERRQFLEKVLNENIKMEKNLLYLSQIHSKDYNCGHSENTWPLNEEDDEVICLDASKSAAAPKYRVKLLQFVENKRPAYWGTWRKSSKTISGRTPFKCDSSFFEYDVDSDDEWVEEEPGESLHGSDDEKESEDDYEVDNDLFVPHGYLSDEEAQNDEINENSPKSQKLKLNILEKQFEAEMKEKTSKLRSRVFGCVYIFNSVKENEGRDDVENLLLSFRAVWNEERTPFCPNLNTEEATLQSTPTVKVKIKTEFPDSLLPDLIKLIHGNKNSSQKLSEEFKMYALNQDATLNLSKLCIINKMREISSWIPNICCWVVNEDVKRLHNLTELSQENSWKYISGINTISAKKSEKQNTTEKPSSISLQPNVTPTTSNQKLRVTANSITKFVKVLTPDEKQKQLNAIVPEKKFVTTPPSNSILNYVTEEMKKGTTSDCTPPFKKRAILFTLDKNDRKSLAVPQSKFGDKISNNQIQKSTNDTIVPSVDNLCSRNESSISTISVKELKSVTVPKLNCVVGTSKNRTEKLDNEIIFVSDDDSNSEQQPACMSNISTNNSLEKVKVAPGNVSADESKSKTECDKLETSKSNSDDEPVKVKHVASPKPNIREVNGKKYAKLITIGKISKE